MKNLLKISTITLMSTAFSLTSCASSDLSRNSIKTTGKVIEYVSDGTGFNTKTVFYEGKDEVVAFDAQFTKKHAEDAIKHLRKFTNKPISWLVITHPNPDKFNGASAFKNEGAKIISSQLTKNNMTQVHAYKKYYFVNIAKMFTGENYPKMPMIDEVFRDELTISLKGGESIELKEYGRPGISLNQTIAVLPNNKGLVVGDLIHHNAHAWLEGGINNSVATPTINEWIELLEEIQNDYKGNTSIYGGRGEVVPLELAIPKQINYLRKSEMIVDTYIQSLGENIQELKSDKANNHYAKITEAFEKEFPNYKLSYMIQYGIYGLVNSKI